jgi:hypothetical protein
MRLLLDEGADVNLEVDDGCMPPHRMRFSMQYSFLTVGAPTRHCETALAAVRWTWPRSQDTMLL